MAYANTAGNLNLGGFFNQFPSTPAPKPAAPTTSYGSPSPTNQSFLNTLANFNKPSQISVTGSPVYPYTPASASNPIGMTQYASAAGPSKPSTGYWSDTLNSFKNVLSGNSFANTGGVDRTNMAGVGALFTPPPTTTYGTSSNPAGTQSAPATPVQTENVGGKTGTVTEDTYSAHGGANAGRSAATPPPSVDRMGQAQADLQRLAAEQKARQADAAAKLKLAQDAASAASASKTTTESDTTFNPDMDAQVKAMNDALAVAQKNYEDAQKDSPEMLAAKQQIDALQAQEAQVSADLGEKTYNVNKEPIPSKFLEGWGTEFNKEANMKLGQISAKRIPLQQQLANLQARRSSALDAAKNAVSVATDNRSRAQGIYEKNYDRKTKLADEAAKTAQENNKPFTLSQGQSEYKFNPATGKYEQIANVAPKPETPKAPVAQRSYDASTIPQNIKGQLVTDIQGNFPIDQIYSAYPEVSTAYIKSLFDSLHPKTNGREI